MVILPASLTSCSDDSYYGLSNDDVMEITKDVAGSGPEIVNILVGDYARTTNTKGTGVVLDRYEWAEGGPDIMVYSFKKDSACFKSTAADGNGACLVDGTLDGDKTIRSGRMAFFSSPEYVLQWTNATDSILLRYPQGKVPYDFYAYTTGGIDVQESSIERENSYISFPLKIDGAADLMYSKASLTESQQSSIPYLGLSQLDESNFTQWCYSDYAAKRGILPVLQFAHALTRISFDLYPGEPGCNKVVVDHVEVMTRDECIFTVASADSLHLMGADFSKDAKDAILRLTEADGSVLNDTLYHTDYHGDFTDDILQRPHIRLGGCFLLPPEESYTFMFYTKVQGYDVTVTTSLKVKPSKGGDFLAGSSYIVRLAMHDVTPVDFDVDVDPWENGGETDVAI